MVCNLSTQPLANLRGCVANHAAQLLRCALVEVGARLVGLIKPSQAKGLAERIRILRRDLSQQRGLWIPPIRVRSSFDIPANDYQIVIAGRKVGSGTLSVPIHTSDAGLGFPGVDVEPSRA